MLLILISLFILAITIFSFFVKPYLWPSSNKKKQIQRIGGSKVYFVPVTNVEMNVEQSIAAHQLEEREQFTNYDNNQIDSDSDYDYDYGNGYGHANQSQKERSVSKNKNQFNAGYVNRNPHYSNFPNIDRSQNENQYSSFQSYDRFNYLNQKKRIKKSKKKNQTEQLEKNSNQKTQPNSFNEIPIKNESQKTNKNRKKDLG